MITHTFVWLYLVWFIWTILSIWLQLNHLTINILNPIVFLFIIIQFHILYTFLCPNSIKRVFKVSLNQVIECVFKSHMNQMYKILKYTLKSINCCKKESYMRGYNQNARFYQWDCVFWSVGQRICGLSTECKPSQL